MLIDNKTDFDNDIPVTLSKYLESNLREGHFDAVTGYFTVDFLARMYRGMNSPQRFRMVLGNLVKDEDRLEDFVINLLKDDLGVNKVLRKNVDA